MAVTIYKYTNENDLTKKKRKKRKKKHTYINDMCLSKQDM